MMTFASDNTGNVKSVNTQTCTHARAGTHVSPCWFWEVVFPRMNVLIRRNESKCLRPQEFNVINLHHKLESKSTRGDVLPPHLDHLVWFNQRNLPWGLKTNHDEVMGDIDETGLDHLQLKFVCSCFVYLPSPYELTHTFVSLSYANTPPQTCTNIALSIILFVSYVSVVFSAHLTLIGALHARV